MTHAGHAELEEEGTELARLVEGTEGLQPWRRVFHATNGILCALALTFVVPSREGAVLGFGALLLLLAALDLIRLRIPSVNTLFFRSFQLFASPREERKPASSTWYVLGIVLILLFFPREVVVPAVLVLGLADPAASVVGRRWGRRRLGKGSVEGAAVFALVAFLVLLPFVGPLPALLAALATSAVEVLPLGMDDNLTVPLAAAAALTFLLA